MQLAWLWAPPAWVGAGPGALGRVWGARSPWRSCLGSGGGGQGAGSASWLRSQPLAPPEEVLESYENPPPIVLPSEGFQVDLDAECPDERVYQHLLYIRHFLCSLRSQPSPSGAPARPEGLQVPGMQQRGTGGSGALSPPLRSAARG